MRHFLITLLLAVISCAAGQFFDPPPINPDPVLDSAATRGLHPATPALTTPAAAADNRPVDRELTRVAVLGYHNFSETKPVTEMLMRTSEFRRQMEYIRSAGLRVISMKEFLDWRLGELRLPARCVLITLDDGWRSVYTDAYPILKEFGYPFTLFLYTKYLTGKGDSMTPDMIREMQAHGATIGSHSTSHLYPKTWKAAAARSEADEQELIDKEIGDSFTRLSELFGPISTYCYPGGYITPSMQRQLPTYGYTAAFGIIPGKVDCQEDVWQVHRYMIFGNNDSIFERAMEFDSAGRKASVPAARLSPTPPFPVYPAPNATVPAGLPLISAQLSSIQNIDLSSVQMSVSGFGRVPVKIDSGTASVSWSPPIRIYLPTLSVHLTWKTYNGASHKTEWFFHISPEVTAQH